MSESTPLKKQFDSYAENGKVIIVTVEYSEWESQRVNVENHISLERAKEILAQLQTTIESLENKTT